MMFNIGEFFKRTQNKAFKEMAVRTAIHDIVLKHSGADISLDSISYSGKAIFLKGISPAERSVIYMKKQKMLGEIASIEGLSAVNDIR